MPPANIAATATVEAGIPNAASGTIPLIFNQEMFDPANIDYYMDPDHPVSFGEPASGSQDVPQDPTQFNWTVFCVNSSETCNADSTTVNDWIDQGGIQATVEPDWLIAPLNAGSHTTLYSSLATLIGRTFPVAIVDDSGVLTGWSCFTLTGSVGGSIKSVVGYFVDGCDMPGGDVVHGSGPHGNFGL